MKKMIKAKESVNGFYRYLRELSVIVIGIAITLTASNWISSRGEKSDLKLYLNTLKMEMEENLRLAESRSSYYKRSTEYATYLLSDKPENLQIDTLRSYRDITTSFFFLGYKTNALEMLKASGYMRLIKDKMLLNDIWDCYAKLEQTKRESDFYMQNKAEAIQQAITGNSVLAIDIRKPENRFLLMFFTNGVDVSLKSEFDACANQIRETLSKFENK